MQVNQNQIKRPSLIEPFFNEELTPDNEFVTYIDCSIKSSSVVHKKSVTPISHNIKKSLKNENYRRAVDNVLVKNCPVFDYGESSKWFFYRRMTFIEPSVMQHRNYYKQYENFSIFDEISAIA